MTYGCVTRGFACSLQLFPGCVNATGRDMETSGNGSTCSHVCANYKSSLGDTGDFLVGSVILFVSKYSACPATCLSVCLLNILIFSLLSSKSLPSFYILKSVYNLFIEERHHQC